MKKIMKTAHPNTLYLKKKRAIYYACLVVPKWIRMVPMFVDETSSFSWGVTLWVADDENRWYRSKMDLPIVLRPSRNGESCNEEKKKKQLKSWKWLLKVAWMLNRHKLKWWRMRMEGLNPEGGVKKFIKKTIAMELAHHQVTHFSAMYSYT